MTTNPVAVGFIATAIAAAICDLRSRRIPNALTFGATAAAIASHAALSGASGVALAAAGWGAGLLLFLPWFLLRGMGGGDVKLLAALGAWIGAASVVWVALYAAIIGGIMALVVAVASGYAGRAFANLYGLLCDWRIAGIRPAPALTLTAGSPRLAYALPMACGAMVWLWIQ